MPEIISKRVNVIGSVTPEKQERIARATEVTKAIMEKSRRLNPKGNLNFTEKMVYKAKRVARKIGLYHRLKVDPEDIKIPRPRNF